MHSNNHDGKKGRTIRPKTFPNYLVSETDESAQSEQRTAPTSSFIAKEMLNTKPSVPFLHQNQGVLQNHQDTKPETIAEKDYFVREQRRFNKEKRVLREQQRWQLNGTFYQSRRPFRPTEFPSLWNQLPERKVEKPTNYKALKRALLIPSDQLILIDKNPPKDDVPKKEATTEKSAPPKKALHRSLKGIMEQEKLQNTWSTPSSLPKKTPPSGFRSYFKE